MRIIRSLKEMVNFSRSCHLKQKTIGFVPTMGALHDGHLRLIKQAKKDNRIVIVSIFVNPLQFGPSEDFSKYPRTLNDDIAMLETLGVDYIWAPSVEEMYGEAVNSQESTVKGQRSKVKGQVGSFF